MSLTAVTATVVDSDGQVWFGGSWKLEFIPNPSNPNLQQYLVDGVSNLNPLVITQTGTMDSGGGLSFTCYDNTSITPIGSSWKLTVCPLSSAQCGIYNFSTAGALINISAPLTFLLPPPRFLGVYPNFGYSDVEVTPSNKPGSTYYNVTIQAQKYYNSNTNTWAIVGTGPTGPTGPPGPSHTATIITAPNVDLNAFTTEGTFYLVQGSGADTPPDVTNSLMAILEVFSYQNVPPLQHPYILQRYQSSQDTELTTGGWNLIGRFYQRWYWWNGGAMVWSDWFEFFPSRYIFDTGEDLNLYIEPGNYYFVQGTGANTPGNMTNSNMAVLEVFAYSNAQSIQHPYILQRFQSSQDAINVSGRYYQRWYSWNGIAMFWTPWFYYLPAGSV